MLQNLSAQKVDLFFKHVREDITFRDFPTDKTIFEIQAFKQDNIYTVWIISDKGSRKILTINADEVE